MDTIEILTDETSTEALARPGLTVDEQPVLAAHFGIRSIPALVVSTASPPERADVHAP